MRLSNSRPIRDQYARMNNKDKSAGQGKCVRCGQCCEKGGPAFHLEDRSLIDSGAIPTRDIYTIREGEPVYDNIKGDFLFAETDIIKIKGRPKPFSNLHFVCLFFEAKKKACKIYEKRPLECRVMKCGDTEGIREVYYRHRLVRKDMLKNIKGLWDIVKDHQSRCSYERLKIFLKVLDDGKNRDAMNGLLDIVSYDENLRIVVSQRSNVDFEITDFLFGRPVSFAMKMFGLKVRKLEGKYILSSAKPIIGLEKQCRPLDGVTKI